MTYYITDVNAGNSHISIQVPIIIDHVLYYLSTKICMLYGNFCDKFL